MVALRDLVKFCMMIQAAKTAYAAVRVIATSLRNIKIITLLFVERM
jgi:hypothetical protein